MCEVMNYIFGVYIIRTEGPVYRKSMKNRHVIIQQLCLVFSYGNG